MGWDTCYSLTTKKMVLEDQLNSMKRSNWEVLGQASTAQGLYFAVKVPTGEAFIACIMVKRHGKYFSTKSMSEDMGPAMYDCPLNLLDLVPGLGSYSPQWRESVRAYHASKQAGKALAKSVLPGMIIALYDGKFKVLQNNKTHLIATKLDDGRNYKITSKQFRSITIEG